MDVILPVFGLAFIGSIAGLLGGIILLMSKKWGRFIGAHAVPFAAGVLLTLSLLDLLPESIEALGIEVTFPFILLVMVVAFLLEQFIIHFHHHDEHKHQELESAIPLVLVGDSLHNFLDGVAIAAAFLIEPRLGLFVAIGTFLHELPQEIGDFGILLSAGWQKLKIIGFNLATALSTFVGAGLTLLFAQDQLVSYLLAVAAGLFLYIAVVDLLPRIGGRAKDVSWHQSASFITGILLMVLVIRIFPD